MHIDVVVATRDRSALLRRTIESLLSARAPEGLNLGIIVVDNGSADDTADVVRACAAAAGGRVRYVLEPRVGKSHALNTGIGLTAGDLVGMVDDDEEVDAGWLEEVARAFAEPDVDYITGPYVPRWASAPPAWLLELGPSAVVGWVDGGPEVRTIGVDYDGIMMGGNAVVRRPVLLAAGPYDPALGPTAAARLGSGEDDDMQRRLHAMGARGQYRPALVIYHHVPAERMTRAYHRRWFVRHGASMGTMARGAGAAREAVPYLLGAPRYRVGRVLRDVFWWVPGLFGVGPLGTRAARFQSRMHSLDLVGYWKGRYL